MSDDDLAGDAHIKIKEVGPQGHDGNKMFIINLPSYISMLKLKQQIGTVSTYMDNNF